MLTHEQIVATITSIQIHIDHAVADVVERMEPMHEKDRLKVEEIVRTHLIRAIQEIHHEFPEGISKRTIQR
jgi:hypothetical protein